MKQSIMQLKKIVDTQHIFFYNLKTYNFIKDLLHDEKNIKTNSMIMIQMYLQTKINHCYTYGLTKEIGHTPWKYLDF